MKRWLPIVLILAAGIVGAILLSRPERRSSSSAGRVLSSNLVARACVSGGGSHALAIAPDGSLWSWGDTGSALGLGTVSSSVLRPTRVGKDNDWSEISAGYSHSLALKRDGSLWAWGSNPSGVLGDGTMQLRMTPTRVGTDHDWLMAGTGLHHSLGLKRDGTIWAWGANTFGELGVPAMAAGTNTSFIPIRVGSATNWRTIAVGALHNVAIKTDGTLWTWGDSSLTPAVAANSPSNHPSPVQIGRDTNWVAVAAGYYHSVALKGDGTLWHWGRNSHLLGSIPAKDSSQPRQFGTNTNWMAVCDGGYHNLARQSDGSLWQLGRGNFSGSSGAVKIDGEWAAVAGGAEFSLALASDGSLWSWGKIIGAKKNPGWLKKTLGALLDKLGVKNQMNQQTTPTRASPEKIFELPLPAGNQTGFE